VRAAVKHVSVICNLQVCPQGRRQAALRQGPVRTRWAAPQWADPQAATRRPLPAAAAEASSLRTCWCAVLPDLLDSMQARMHIRISYQALHAVCCVARYSGTGMDATVLPLQGYFIRCSCGGSLDCHVSSCRCRTTRWAASSAARAATSIASGRLAAPASRWVGVTPCQRAALGLPHTLQLTGFVVCMHVDWKRGCFVVSRPQVVLLPLA